MSVALKKSNVVEMSDASAHDLDREADILAENDEAAEDDDGLLAVAGPIMASAYALLLAVAAVTFFRSGGAFFAVVISIVFAAIYFAIPMLFFKIRRTQDQRFHKSELTASSVVDVWTGPMHRWEAIVQIVSIPLAILLGFTLLAIRWGTL
ncbi:hypothetical protein [Hyphomicrobium sp.]|mgnify:FL=1|uniref:hypothetical protein n=1 Tax=Hyphomicrobium sp. TaxID=82 RepID=UPI002FE3A8A8